MPMARGPAPRSSISGTIETRKTNRIFQSICYNCSILMEISIIIPVFNAEKYLDRCLLSVVDSLRNAGSRGEIVLVDNLSTDGSLKIAKKWQKKLSCEKALALRVVECQIPGAAATKNAGVREAKGKYIWFVDADDTIAETAVARILKVTKTAGSMRLGEAKTRTFMK